MTTPAMLVQPRKLRAMEAAANASGVATSADELGANAAGTARRTGVAYLAGVLVVVAFIASMAKGIVHLPEEGVTATRPVRDATTARLEPARFILNGVLVPALDTDALPLRWVDPRPAMRCGPGASMRVNGGPLVPGELVPDEPFVLEWHADGCTPFGTAGPRFDGDVTLTVFREDWGFSAIVAPRDLRIAPPSHPPARVQAGGSTMPQTAPEEEALPGE